ncbi:MAG: LysR family transcriptional regulator [Gammaproteobacteria bacterium]
MSQIDDMLLFAKLVELKSFTAVAEANQISRSLVSKRISRLEDRLGIQLVNRTTRRLALTEAGQTYYHYCIQLESTLHEAETAVSDIRRQPKGNLNINVPVTYGQYVLPDIIVRFLEEYQDVKINLSLTDQFVDVLEGGYDVIIRIGELKSSTLKARKIGTTRLRLFAHKNYLQRFGTPQTPSDLKNHNCITYQYMKSGIDEWHFKNENRNFSVPIAGNFHVNNGIPIIRAVQNGLGIAVQPDFILDKIKDNDIRYLLEDYFHKEVGIYAVYPSTKKTPLNTRAFIDFLVAHGKEST